MRLILSGIALLALAACKPSAPPPPPPPGVVVAPPLSQSVTDWDDYTGRFEAVDNVEIRPRVSGAIESIHFKDGEKVDKGQLLFVIDPRPYAAQLARAQADLAGARAVLANADAELHRGESLVTQKLISQSQAELLAAQQQQAAAALAAAEAAVTTAELNLSYTRVTAPISGRASWRRLAPGNLVVADNTLLTTVVSENPIRFVFDAPEAALLRYRRQSDSARAMPVDIRLQDETDYRWKGKVEFIDNAFDRSSGTISARAVLDNPDGFLTPGMFGQMRLYASAPFDALLLPDEAIVTDQTRQVVYVVDDAGIVSQKIVRPGRLINGLRVIREGVSPQDRVVISGVQRARPGRAVSVTQGVVTAFPSGVSRGETSTLTLSPSAAASPTAQAQGGTKPDSTD
ncbi:MAG: efflux RND transporter periplasmic adaptor subunit [Nevskiaceae bacterium]|jgi:RND family efflux transporter MFP subunit|nr:efflux RND transporter periplasmic adaptor subunit [Nevskiaceae bacterium]